MEVLKLPARRYPNLKNVNLQGNPLSIYPVKCRTSWTKMSEYLENISKRAEHFIGKKLIFVGESKTGKSTLLKCFKKRNYKTKCHSYKPTKGISTSEISINNEQYSNITYTAWDISGNESYLTNKHFFITSRAIYVLTININQINIDKILFWLQLIQTICKESNSVDNSYMKMDDEIISPVFIVATHFDDNKKYDKSYLSEVEDEIVKLNHQIRFHGFQGFFPVSCKYGDGIQKLLSSICKFTITHTKHLGFIFLPFLLFILILLSPSSFLPLSFFTLSLLCTLFPLTPFPLYPFTRLPVYPFRLSPFTPFLLSRFPLSPPLFYNCYFLPPYQWQYYYLHWRSIIIIINAWTAT